MTWSEDAPARLLVRHAEHHWDLMAEGMVTARAVGCDAEAWPLSVSSENRRSKTLGRTSSLRPQTPRTTSLWTPPTTSLNTQRYCWPLLGSGQSLGRRRMPIFEL